MPSKQPFEVITDHRNLEYLGDAKSLNPQQAHWALFFTHFNFTVTYRPGQKNQKADALSHMHNPKPNSSPHEPILPSVIIVRPIHGPSMTGSLKPHAQSQLRREVLRDGFMYQLLSTYPSRTADPLAHQQSLLQAQYGPEYLLVCKRMLSLCHLKGSSEYI